MHLMEDLLRPLREATLPAFGLFKNLVLDDPGSPDSAIVQFEWVKLGSRPDILERHVPSPIIPHDLSLRDLLRSTSRFEDSVNPSTGDIDTSDLTFDLTVSHLVEPPSDAVLFGESYTLLLLCPPHEDTTATYLVDRLLEMAQGKRITDIELYGLWHDYVDRMLFFPSAAEDPEVNAWHDIIAEVERRIKTLPNAPTEHDWAEMERYL